MVYRIHRAASLIVARPAKFHPPPAASAVIGRQLGGTAAKKSGNTFPQNTDRNRGAQNQREDSLKNQLPDKCVCARIKLNYGDPLYPDRPVSVEYEGWVDGVLQTSQPFIPKVIPNP